MSDPKSQLLYRISVGTIPTESSIKKYNISFDDINNIRESKNLEKLPTNHHLNYIDESISNISLTSIIKYINLNVKNLSTRILYTQKATTLFTIILKNINTEKKMIDILNKDKEIIKIINEKYSNINTRLSYIQFILWLLDNYPPLSFKIKSDIKKKYKDKHLLLKNDSESIQINKLDDSIIPFSEIYNKLIKKYPEDSKERLLMEIYNSITLRDDLGNVLIVSYIKDATDKNRNYLVNKKNPILILNDYKTSEKYGKIKHILPEIVYEILKAQKKESGMLLFSKDSLGIEAYGGNKPSLSNFIRDMLMESGIEKNGNGPINFLRHSRLTELLKNVSSASERSKIALNAMHSPVMSLQYIRKMK